MADNYTRIKRQGLDIDSIDEGLGFTLLSGRVTTLEGDTVKIAIFETLQTSVGNLQTALTTTDANVASLITSQGTQDTKITNLETTTSSLTTDVADLKQKTDNLSIDLGTINLNTADVTPEALAERVTELGYTDLKKGYTLYDLDNHEWQYNGTVWADLGVSQAVSIATSATAGIVRGSTANLAISYDNSGVGTVNGLADALGDKANTGDVTTLAGRVTTNEGKIETLEGNYTTLSGSVTTLSGKVTTAEGNITTLQTDLGTLQGTVSDLQTEVTTHGSAISDLQTAVSGKQAELSWSSDFAVTDDSVTLDMATFLASHHVTNEVLTGTPDGTRKAFTLATTPLQIDGIWRDGQKLTLTNDYTIAGNTITLVSAPVAGTVLTANYWK